MLTTLPHLSSRRPSPTTVEYTVSTKPLPTLSLGLLLTSFFLLRILLGLSTLLLLYSKWMLSIYSSSLQRFETRPPLFSVEFIWYAVYALHNSPLGLTFTRLASSIPLILLSPVSILVGYVAILRIHTEESLLILRGLGVQTSSSSSTYLSTATTRFIPTEKIQDVFVNEGFRGFEVRYYLVVVVEGEEEVVVVFPSLLPRRRIVETVWRGCRECLYETRQWDSTDKDGGKVKFEN